MVGGLSIVNKEPKILKGVLRKIEIGDGRKSTIGEKIAKQEKKTLRIG